MSQVRVAVAARLGVGLPPAASGASKAEDAGQFRASLAERGVVIAAADAGKPVAPALVADTLAGDKPAAVQGGAAAIERGPAAQEQAVAETVAAESFPKVATTLVAKRADGSAAAPAKKVEIAAGAEVKAEASVASPVTPGPVQEGFAVMVVSPVMVPQEGAVPVVVPGPGKGAMPVASVTKKKELGSKEAVTGPVAVTADAAPGKAAPVAEAPVTGPGNEARAAVTFAPVGLVAVVSPPVEGHGLAQTSAALPAAPATVEHVAVAGDDAMAAPQPEDARTLTATAQVLEVGVASGTHGWLRVRAEMGSGGEVAASVVANSAEAVQSLHRELPGLSAYLAREQVGVASVAVTSAGVPAQEGGGSLAADAGGRDQARRQGAGQSSREFEPWSEVEGGSFVGLGETPSLYGPGGGWVNLRV